MYQGSKYFFTGKFKVSYDIWGNEVKKPIILPQSHYIKYLEQKEKEKKEIELLSLKCKLDYQLSNYGEVEKIDFDRYIYLLNKSYEK